MCGAFANHSQAQLLAVESVQFLKRTVLTPVVGHGSGRQRRTSSQASSQFLCNAEARPSQFGPSLSVPPRRDLRNVQGRQEHGVHPACHQDARRRTAEPPSSCRCDCVVQAAGRRQVGRCCENGPGWATALRALSLAEILTRTGKSYSRMFTVGAVAPKTHV